MPPKKKVTKKVTKKKVTKKKNTKKKVTKKKNTKKKVTKKKVTQKKVTQKKVKVKKAKSTRLAGGSQCPLGTTRTKRKLIGGKSKWVCRKMKTCPSGTREHRHHITGKRSCKKLQPKKAKKVWSSDDLLSFTPKLPSLSLPHKQFVKAITKEFGRYTWAVPQLENACKFKKGQGLTLSETQNFMRHYMLPNNPVKGLMLVISTGGGKTCTAVALADNFRRVIWVTKRNLMPGIWNAMFEDLCSGIVKEWKKLNKPVPTSVSDRLKILKDRGSEWVLPMSYRQFSNALSGKSKGIMDAIRKSSPNPKDPLAEALVVFDEAHYLYDGSLPTVQKPQMKYVTDAFSKSYTVSGSNSVKALLMTATPAEKPSTLFQLLNLMIEKKKDKLPTTEKQILKEFAAPNGKMLGLAATRLVEATKGTISYLNALNDPSKFAQVKRAEPIKVTISTVQAKKIKSCLAKSIKKPGDCIRKKLNATERKAADSFDHKDFNGPDFMKRLPEISPKFMALMENIYKLDQADKAKEGHKFKHIIFSDIRGGFGAKFIASAMLATGKYNMIVKKQGNKMVIDGKKVGNKTNIAILTTAGLYKRSTGRIPFSNQLITSIIDKKKGFMNQSDNNFGQKCQVLILNGDFSVGIDVLDARYVHFFNPQISEANITQAEGRGTRFCGTTGLKFVKGKGWILDVFNYTSLWDTPESETKIGKGMQPFELARSKISEGDLKTAKFYNQLRNLMFTSAVDRNLNAGINLGSLLK
jgi:hypothetical protein